MPTRTRSAPSRSSRRGVYRQPARRRSRAWAPPSKPFWTYLAASGNWGATGDEQGITLTTGTGTTSLAYQTTTKRTGRGAWRWQGGTCTAGEFSLSQQSPWTANGQSDLWLGMAFRVDTLHSTADLLWLLGANIAGNGGTSSNKKPTLKLKSDGTLYLGDSNSTTNDTVLAVISTGVWYYVWLHGMRSNGADDRYQEAYLYDGDPSSGGALLASCSKLWDVATTSASDKMKWCGGTTQDSTGLDLYAEDLVAVLGPTACPGPLQIFTRTPSSVTAAGNWTATGAADCAAATASYPSDGDTSYAGVNNSTASSLVLGMTTASIPSTSLVRAIIPRVVSEHTGSLPTVTLGVRVSGTDSILVDDYQQSTAAYVARRGAYGGTIDGYSITRDPVTGQPFTATAADGCDMVIRDADAVAREIRVTAAGLDVVTVQVPGNTKTGAAALTGSGTLSATGARTVLGAAALTGTGTASATGTRTVLGAAALTGAGSLSAAGTRTRTGAAALTGTGTLSASWGAQAVTGAAALTGTGTLSASGTRTRTGAATLTGTGTLSGTGTTTRVGAAALVGTGTLSASWGAQAATGAAALTGTGTASATGTRTVLGAAALTGTGTLVVRTDVTAVGPTASYHRHSTASYHRHSTATWRP